MRVGNGKKGEKSEKGWCVISSGGKEETKIWEWCLLKGQARLSCTAQGEITLESYLVSEENCT